MERAVREIALAHPGQTVALFSHGTAIRQFLARAGRIPPEEWGGQPHSENTAVTCLAFNGEDFSLVYQSDSSHVPEELATLGKQQWWRKSGKAEDVNLWYSPLDPARDWDLYLEARREALALAQEGRERALCANACLIARFLRKRGRRAYASGAAVLEALTVEQIQDLAGRWAAFSVSSAAGCQAAGKNSRTALRSCRWSGRVCFCWPLSG